MGLTVLLGLLLGAVAGTATKVHQRHDMLFVPHADNIEAFVAENPFVLLFFFHETQEESLAARKIIHHLSEYFGLMSEKNQVLFGQVDMDTDSDAAAKLGVTTAPMIRLFHHGVGVPFRGRFGYEEVKRWIRKFSEQKPIFVGEGEESFLHEDQVSCVFGRSGFTDQELQTLETMAETHHEVIFYYSNATKHLDANQTDSAYKLAVRRRADGHLQALRGTGELRREDAEAFLETAKLPDSVPFHAFEHNRFFHKKPTTCFLFLAAPDPAKLDAFRRVGRKFKKRLEFSHVNTTTPIGSRFAHLMGVKSHRSGVVKIVHFEGDLQMKFRLKHWETQTQLESFVEAYLRGEVPAYFKSEPVPSPNDGPVLKLVGKTVHKLVFENPNHVLVFANFNLEHDEDDFLLVRQVAEKLDHALDRLTVATFDATRNDHRSLHLKAYPSFVVFPAGRKHQPCVGGDFDGAAEVVRFVERCLGAKIRYPGEERPLNLDESL